MGIDDIIGKLIKKMKQKPNVTIFSILIVYAVFRIWDRANGVQKTLPSPPPQPIFNVTEFVNEIHSGCLKQRDSLLQQSDISFVFYYAPWCHSSMEAADHFIKVARKFHNEVSFIAINCWWIKGECRGKASELNFPRLYLYHRSCKRPIQYKGPHLFQYYKTFLTKALHPVVYLGTNENVALFLKSNQIAVIGSFCHPAATATLIGRYIEIALISLEKYPSSFVQFGLVLSRKLSSELEIKHKVLKMFDQTISDTYGVQEFHLQRNTTPDEVVKWALNQQVALQRVFPIGEKSNTLHKVLSGGPSLLAFMLNVEQHETMNGIAIRYNKLKELHCHCCQSATGSPTYSVCLKNGSPVNSLPKCDLADVMIKRLRMNPIESLLPPGGRCKTTSSLYDAQRSRIEICSLQNAKTTFPYASTNYTSIDGLSHHANQTLQFVALDLNLTAGMAEALGFSSRSSTVPYTVIVDLQNEQKYVMGVDFTESNLEKFILNYTNGQLNPIQSTENEKFTKFPNVEPTDEFVTIPSVSSRSFENTVLQSSKDVLLYYHSSWCGGCSSYSHVLMTLQSRKDNFKNLLIYQVNEQTNEELPLSFKALSYPTLILFPGMRTGDSVVFSKSVLCTLPNIVGFLLRHASPATKAQLLLSACSSNKTNGSKLLLPYDICRKQDIIERVRFERLNLRRLRAFDKTLDCALRRWHLHVRWNVSPEHGSTYMSDLRIEKQKIMGRARKLTSVINSLTSLTV